MFLPARFFFERIQWNCWIYWIFVGWVGTWFACLLWWRRGRRWCQSHDCHIEYRDFMDLDFAKRLHEKFCTPGTPDSLYIVWYRSMLLKLLKTPKDLCLFPSPFREPKANLGLWDCCVSVGQVLTRPVKGWLPQIITWVDSTIVFGLWGPSKLLPRSFA